MEKLRQQGNLGKVLWFLKLLSAFQFTFLSVGAVQKCPCSSSCRDCVHHKEDIWYLLWLQVYLISRRFYRLKKSQNSIGEYQLISCEKLPQRHCSVGGMCRIIVGAEPNMVPVCALAPEIANAWFSWWWVCQLLFHPLHVSFKIGTCTLPNKSPI